MAKKTAIRWVAAGDNHGDELDLKAVDAFHGFVKEYKPDIRVHLGDAFNFASLRKNCSDAESRMRLGDDLAAGCEFMDKYKPTHWLRGNHDERIYDAYKGDEGPKADLAYSFTKEIESAIGKAEMFPYNKRDGVLRLGHLKLIHGYHSGITAARQAALVYGAVIMGHVHTIDHYSVPGLERRVGRAVGCLCKLDLDYNRAQANTLRQAHGWAYGLLFPGGDYTVWQAEQVGGQWHIPTGWKTL